MPVIPWSLSEISLFLTVVSSVIGLLGYIMGWWRSFWGFLKRLLFKNKKKGSLPTETVRVVPDFARMYWSEGSQNGEPISHVHGDFHVTNVTKHDVLILAASITRPRVDGYTMTKDYRSQYHGSYPIPPGVTTKVDVGVIVKPPLKRNNFKTNVILVDQLGNRHKIKGVVFKRQGK